METALPADTPKPTQEFLLILTVIRTASEPAGWKSRVRPLVSPTFEAVPTVGVPEPCVAVAVAVLAVEVLAVEVLAVDVVVVSPALGAVQDVVESA
mmetsp:Transcript_84414/g.239307  ORF Transcript_84414/g.239307 Transcript_84414/m.239307 type:complete len:96 (-) Transcript_84414:429-716(-)